MVSCPDGHPHQIPTGAALDPDSHSCPVTCLEDILLPCLTSPASSLRTSICWSCYSCNRTFRGTTASCSSEDCRGKPGTTFSLVARRFTAVVNAVAAQTAPMWKGGDEEFPEALSANMLCELLLTPHGNHLSGLQHGAWTLQEDEGKCSCTTNREPMEVDCPAELMSCTTSSTNIVDVEASTGPIDASGAPFGHTDIREREPIKLTLKIPKKKNKNKKKSKKSSPPPSKSSSLPTPGTSTSSAHDPPAKKKPKKAGPITSPTSQIPDPNLTQKAQSYFSQKIKSLPRIPKVPQPTTAPPTPKPRKALLPTPTLATPTKDSSTSTPGTPSTNTATANNNNVSDSVVPVKDKEHASKSRGNPQSWGMWWCWIQECGLVNYMPQDWCSHCGHSKHAKQGNVHLNNLKRKLAKISGGAAD